MTEGGWGWPHVGNPGFVLILRTSRSPRRPWSRAPRGCQEHTVDHEGSSGFLTKPHDPVRDRRQGAQTAWPEAPRRPEGPPEPTGYLTESRETEACSAGP